ncbi:MAG: hypothetical protein JO151_06090, partial [Verrucomicrobia bacterium]|nr:hypothetical protein [Verrucomicrobiota bacterium]
MITTELSSILSGTRQASGLDWFRELQAQAWDEFEAEPFPVRTNELWRFSSLKSLSLDGYISAPEFSGDASCLTEQREFLNPAGRIIFANETLLSAQLLDPALKRAGVIFTTLSQALEKHSDLLREHFMAQPARLGSAKFAALHKAVVKAGA